MEYKCLNCGGELRFDPKLGKLRCDFCGETYDVDQFEHDHDHAHDHHHEPDLPQYTKAMDDSTEFAEDLTAFACPHCGAEMVTSKDTVSTKCVFCGTPMVIEEQVQGEFRPSRLLPFAIEKKELGQIYEQYIANKPFYPPEYSKANVIAKIKAVYLPFWLYDLQISGQVDGTGERTMTVTTGKWIVTTHEVFNLFRQGHMNFSKIPAIASSRTPQDAMDALEPFDYSQLKDYNPGFLPGFLAQRWDLDDKQMLEKAKGRAENSFNTAMMQTMSGYEGVRLNGGTMDAAQVIPESVLMPVYLLFMDYDHDEDKLIAINGQNGKIAGNIPIDPAKVRRCFIKWFLILWLILFLVFMAGLIVFA